MTWRSDSIEVVRGQGRTMDRPICRLGANVINRKLGEKWLVGTPNTLILIGFMVYTEKLATTPRPRALTAGMIAARFGIL
jgi:hypothetical protein